jgi:hypothetical protein
MIGLLRFVLAVLALPFKSELRLESRVSSSRPAEGNLCICADADDAGVAAFLAGHQTAAMGRSVGRSRTIRGGAQAEMELSFQSEDFAEGIAHFLERRNPAFTGR